MGQTEAAVAGSTGELSYEIGFASPVNEEHMWDFLLLSPSPQHTAALCVQRGPAKISSTRSSSTGANDDAEVSSEGDADRLLSNQPVSRSFESSSSMCSTDSESTRFGEAVNGAGGHEKPRDNWRLHCWKTVPFVHDRPMDPSELLIHGCSAR